MALPKQNLFNVNFTLTNYHQAAQIIVDNGIKHDSFGVSALAVHGLIESYRNPDICTKVNKIDFVVPDGQPIRWALNFFYNTELKDRVYGPQLTLEVLKQANAKNLKVFLFGSTELTLQKFTLFITTMFPEVEICGIHIDRFREATPEEDAADIRKINESGANIVLVGRGCPRQEIWVSDHLGKINAAMMAVGAAFDFHAGVIKQAPRWMQQRGLEWLYRLVKEPKRLWKRYLITNSFFIYLVIKKILFPKWD
ncbi:MAG TPA: WecB/TagA/CpsF family glycosyltransferase [Lacibacter sp.]|nr:WecB/TagA/CpsF family glycosyltransferase [Lacibacter sp.]